MIASSVIGDQIPAGRLLPNTKKIELKWPKVLVAENCHPTVRLQLISGINLKILSPYSHFYVKGYFYAKFFDIVITRHGFLSHKKVLELVYKSHVTVQRGPITDIESLKSHASIYSDSSRNNFCLCEGTEQNQEAAASCPWKQEKDAEEDSSQNCPSNGFGKCFIRCNGLCHDEDRN